MSPPPDALQFGAFCVVQAAIYTALGCHALQMATLTKSREVARVAMAHWGMAVLMLCLHGSYMGVDS